MKKLDKYGLCKEEYTDNNLIANVYYKRAIGKMPEMESSKALSKIVKKYLKENDRIADVGCACGHYYYSLKKIIKKNFFYTGLDPYDVFLNKAKIAWKNDKKAKFVKGNILNIPLPKKNFDIVYASNVLIHIHKSDRAIKELMKITKKYLIIRTVVYDVSYKVQLVYNNKWWKYTDVKPVNEFDKNGNPRSFSYFNILSFDYIKETVKSINKKAKVSFIKDNFYSKSKIHKSIKKEKRPLATRIIGKEQFSGALMQPHYFVIIKL